MSGTVIKVKTITDINSILIKSGMYLDIPVITRLHNDFYSYGETRETHKDFGTREAVMEYYEAKDWIRVYTAGAKWFAYKVWLLEYKSLFRCLLCGQRDPQKLIFHHLGEEYTGMPKLDRIANMVTKRRPLEEIEYEMSKCTVLCASCHQKTESGGEKALRELYEMHEQYYGEKNYRPGDKWESTKFEKDFNHIEIEILSFLIVSPHLDKYV